MCLIHHKKIEMKFSHFPEQPGRLVGRHGHAAVPDPGLQRSIPHCAVYLRNRQCAFSPNLPAPVRDHAGRTHHQEMRDARICGRFLVRICGSSPTCILQGSLPHILQRDHGCDSLHCFSEPHLIPEKHPLLMKDVFHAPFLIAPQFAAQPFEKDFLVPDLLRQVLRQPVDSIGRAQHTRNDLLQYVEKPDTVLPEISPGKGPVKARGFLREPDDPPGLRPVSAAQKAGKICESFLRLLLFRPAGEKPLQPV